MNVKWKKQKKAVVVSALCILGGFSMFAYAQGGEDNPLITMSYLKNVFSQEVLQETDQKIANAEQAYLDKLEAKKQELSAEMKTIPASSGKSDAVLFALVDLSEGQRITGSVGCEVMLRVGSAVCVSDGSPGLIDMTTAETLENGQYLQKNHLYIATMEGRAIQAIDSSVKILVRGQYTIES